MTDDRDPDVYLRSWTPDDFALLERLLGDPEMTRYIGGPESPEKLRSRHERYLDFTAPGGTFAVTTEPGGPGVGWVGYWEGEWADEPVWEAGWSVLPEHQGKGIATAAMRLVLERAREDGRFRYVDAYPSVENAASNGVCRRLGFESLGEVDVEYPPGTTMRSKHWRFDLLEPAAPSGGRRASRWGFSEDEWLGMTLGLQGLLVEAARHRGTVTYGEIAKRVFGGRVLARSSAVMALVDDACDVLDEGRGTVTASLVVRSDTGMPGEGYFRWAESAGYDVADREGFWREQAERVWESWSDDNALASTERELEVPECGSTASD